MKKDFKSFKKFLDEKCQDKELYCEGKYDRKIYNWFRVEKPVKIAFYTKDGKKKLFKAIKT